MSVTTLVLTFYLNKAFSLWRDIYDKGTKVKGRINDISMVLGEYRLENSVPYWEGQNSEKTALKSIVSHHFQRYLFSVHVVGSMHCRT